MNTELGLVACCLDEASRLLSVGQMEQACTHLSQAADILDRLYIAHISPALKPVTTADMPQAQADERTLVMAAAA